jgi:hypothetical protein
MLSVQRQYLGEVDLRRMTTLAKAYRAHNLHVVDLPYRLSSWAVDYPENIGLWVGNDGELIGWAIMQAPFWTIDYAYHPSAAPDLHERILRWADERASALLVGTPSGRPMWFINVFADEMDRRRELE